jgi:hypothetical protein
MPAISFLILAQSTPAFAHALPQRYELPVPLDLYLGAAGAVVGLSFVLLVFTVRSPSTNFRYPKFDLLSIGAVHQASDALYRILQGVGVAAFGIVIAAGLFGNQHGLKNIAPVLVWVIWWVGLAIFSPLLGNAWSALNPWRTLFAAMERILQRKGALVDVRPYPFWLGSWPAVAFYVVFAWMELIWPQAERPRSLALAALAYSAITWTGMAVYGREIWLKYAEVFTVFFGILGRFAPVAAGSDDPDPPGTLRPYAIALLPERPLSGSKLVFVMTMLASVTFDGLRETPWWRNIEEHLWPAPNLLKSAGADAHATFDSIALLLMPLVFLAVYSLACWIATLCTAHDKMIGRDAAEFARLFALTLVPIAIAYHFAHYLSYLLLAGQFAIPLASDPFGFGWDLFGTTLYRFDIGIIDARQVWSVCLTAIVLGHVAAVYLAHRIAINWLSKDGSPLCSQIPMVTLMIGYTMTSLWILAQPIVVSPRAG